MFRAYVRPTARFPKEPQIAAVKAAGAKRIYVESAAEGWTHFLNSLRAGDTAVVANFDRLGETRIIGAQRLGKLIEKGVRIMDAYSGTVADPAALAAWDRARTNWTSESIATPRQAKARARKGGKAKAQNFEASLGLSRDEMRTIWHESDSNAEASERTGISERTLYRWFGPSKRKPGRRGNN